jgi:ParB-like chromosome segregation protein Spo0J
MNDLHIQHYPLDQLIPYARNARTHADEQISQIAGSIAEFGFVNPILVGDDNVIIAGHGRLMAAQRLGLKTVPVIMLAHLSETQRRALVIADNKIAENAGWDEEMLRLELQALREADFDLDITGFDFEDLERLLNGEQAENQGLTDDDAAPEIQENPISQPGDLWLLGDHRVLCGPVGVADKIYLACNARRHGVGGYGKGHGRRSCRHGLYRPAL